MKDALKNLVAVWAVCLFSLPMANASLGPIAPVVGSFNDVTSPESKSVDAYIPKDFPHGTMWVTFNLMASADVTVGAQALPPLGDSSFHIDRIVLVGENGQFTPDFCLSGCTEIHVPLSTGEYALGVIGDGNRTLAPPGADPFDPKWDQPDFRAYIQAVPEPETYALLLAGIGLVGLMARLRTRRKFDDLVVRIP